MTRKPSPLVVQPFRGSGAGLPADYAERTYAGVLGKIIGVYLGRPFEGWTHQQIMSRLGEVRYYVNDRRDVELKNYRLVVPDDDITGTLTFPRALRDYPGGAVDAARIGSTWLNYIIEGRTVLWWGGRGVSTEHTAYLLMKDGLAAPATGSAVRNGPVVAEQVGAQIFVEGWAMACPGDPERAAALSAQAASVSHDGEALNAARVVAALVAQAFVEDDIDALLDTATALIPPRSLIYRVIQDIRDWHRSGEDWRQGYTRIADRYGYHRYPGNCHVVPNHALVIHALAHSRGEFSQALRIVSSCGWDTDSNAGNVGCITGVRGGLAGIDAGPDWRGPVADRIYLPTADGGAAITDAAREAMTIVGYGHALRGKPMPVIKAGARFHFELPGSVQGFAAEPPSGLHLQNTAGHSESGSRSLALHYDGSRPVMALASTFLTPDTLILPPYGMVASPTLYPGQHVKARIVAGDADVTCGLIAHAYDGEDNRRRLAAPESTVRAGQCATLTWRVPDTGGQPIADVGVMLASSEARPGTAFLDYLTWDGAPEVTLSRPAGGGTMWRHAWVDAVDSYDPRWPEPYRLVQNRGIGMISQGSRDWRNYEVTADVTPRLARAVGLGVRVQGLRRYYAVRLVERRAVQLVRVLGDLQVLAERDLDWDFYRTYHLRLTVAANRLSASVDDAELTATDDAFDSGGVALLIEEGHTATEAVHVRPYSSPPASR